MSFPLYEYNRNCEYFVFGKGCIPQFQGLGEEVALCGRSSWRGGKKMDGVARFADYVVV